MLKETFISLVSNYTDDKIVIDKLWLEIDMNYSSKKRYYHTLNHLKTILKELLSIKHEIQNWESILFSIFYHDIVYSSLRTDNEEKSLEFAEKRMKELNVPNETIEQTKTQIINTKKHHLSAEKDTNYFTDADLSILGSNWDTYYSYFINIRKEYSIYPDFVYNKGRKKTLIYFLEMETIFKTNYFYKKYENKAKINLRKEIKLLA